MANPAVERLRVDRRSLDLYAVPEIPALDPGARQKLPDLGRHVDQLIDWRQRFNSDLRDKLLALSELQKIRDEIGAVQVSVDDTDRKSAARDRAIEEEVEVIDNRTTKIESNYAWLYALVNQYVTLVNEIESKINTSPDWRLVSFSSPTNPWTIAHTMKRFVTVTLFDTSGNIIAGHVNQPDTANVTVTFSGSLAGSALLS
jgi:hypothetical protein